MKDGTLYLGRQARLDFLMSIRQSLETEDGREALYDNARAICAGLIRSVRPKQELLAWRDAFSRVSALAQTIDGCGQVTARFDVLAHLISDEEMYRSAYSTEDLLKLPHYSSFLGWLHQAGITSFEVMFQQLSLKENVLRTVIQLLSQQQLVDWSEESGSLLVWITEKGSREVIRL